MTSTDITLIDSSTELSDGANTYAVDASEDNIDLTLPSISGDGMNFKLIRWDTSENVVTLVRTSPDLIYLNSGVLGVTSYVIPPLTVLEVQSLNGDWHVTINSSITRTESKVLHSSQFGVPFTAVVGTGSRAVLCAFVYPGTSSELINVLDLVLTTVGLGFTGTISLTDSGGATTYGSVSFSPAAGAQIVSITSFTGLPSTKSVLEVGITLPALEITNVFSVCVK